MKRTTEPAANGYRQVIYTSDDGAFVARSVPYPPWWRIVSTGPAQPAGVWEGPFRSEKEAMDQARSRVRWYEQWPDGAPWERLEGGR